MSVSVSLTPQDPDPSTPVESDPDSAAAAGAGTGILASDAPAMAAKKKTAKKKNPEAKKAAKSKKKKKTTTKKGPATKKKRKRNPGASKAKDKSLVIVESPAKARTINKFLGDNYIVKSSKGHVRDLVKRKFGIDIDRVVLTDGFELRGEFVNPQDRMDALRGSKEGPSFHFLSSDVKGVKARFPDSKRGRVEIPRAEVKTAELVFEPQYAVEGRSQEIIEDLEADAEVAKTVYLATDKDREGEAIAWHLHQALELPDEKAVRVSFTEITRNAILDAFQHGGRIDDNKVNAQQARRILDRIVGYKLSPLLWEKVMRGASAGRVQSVATRLICEREREVQAFRPHEYWTIEVDVAPEGAEAAALQTPPAGNPPPFDADNPEGEGAEKTAPGQFRMDLKIWRATAPEFAAKIRAELEDDAREAIATLSRANPQPFYELAVARDPQAFAGFRDDDGAAVHNVWTPQEERSEEFEGDIGDADGNDNGANNANGGEDSGPALNHYNPKRFGETVGRVLTAERDGHRPTVDELLQVVGDVFQPDADGYYELKLVPRDDLRRRPFVDGILERLDPAEYKVVDVKRTVRSQKPPAPFITSTLQQVASTVLRFPAKITMQRAQGLYEGIDVGEGPVGLITYMRTDSTAIADEAVREAREYIKRTFGDRYLPEEPHVYKSRAKGAQEAHECIRPTNVNLHPDRIKHHFELKKTHPQHRSRREQWELYRLIWNRFVACQMAKREYRQTTVDVAADRGLFRATGREEVFDGFTRILTLKAEGMPLPPLSSGDALTLIKLHALPHETSPPPRYTEASLVKTLEMDGIGRPSTYASILSRIQETGYVELKERKFHATETGLAVTDRLVEHFPREMAYQFTSTVEEQLDRIERGETFLNDIVRNFYIAFAEDLERAKAEMKSTKGEDAEKAPWPCPKCGAEMIKRHSRRGIFYGCVKYPDCDGKRDQDGNPPVAPQASEYKCNMPDCGGTMLYRMGKRGQFLGCSNYPTCTNTYQLQEDGTPVIEPIAEERCPKCGSPMKVRRSKRGRFLGCTKYPKCRGTLPMPGEEDGKDKEQEKAVAESDSKEDGREATE